jgi:hypothetical protein
VLTWISPPSGHAPHKAVRRTAVAHRVIDAAGVFLDYRNEALEWNLSESETIVLFFRAPWFTDCEVELFLWSEFDLTLEGSTGSNEKCSRISLGRNSGGIPRIAIATIPVPFNVEGDASTTKLSFSVTAGMKPDARVFFGLRDPRVGTQTCLHAKIAWTGRFWFWLATWLIAFCTLFLALSCSKIPGPALIFTALPALPALLDRLGLRWASSLDVNRLALFLYRMFHPVARSMWILLTLPLVAYTVFAVWALLMPVYFRYELEDQLKKDISDPEHITFFCRYPERIEARVLLARHYSQFGRGDKAVRDLLDAVKVIRKALPTDKFLNGCLSHSRIKRFFLRDADSMEDEARIFYASLLFNTIETFKDFDRMPEIRKILGGDSGGALARGPLATLTLAKYELRSIKNTTAYECEVAPASLACQTGVDKCKVAKTRFEGLLAKPNNWDNVDRRNSVTYIESLDLAASARLSRECGGGTAADVEEAIKLYKQMLRTIPAEPKLDQNLSQINLRNLTDAELDVRSVDYHPKDWVKRCNADLAEVCRQIKQAVIKDGKDRFFSADPIQREEEWGKASLASAAIKEKDLKEKLLDETNKRWREPCKL